MPYELKMLPFPPRVFAKDYLALNPLGTIPFMIDGEIKMTELAATPITSPPNTARRPGTSAPTTRPTARTSTGCISRRRR